MKGVPLMKGVLTEVVVLLRQFVREAEVRVRLKKKIDTKLVNNAHSNAKKACP